jgi:hypothetical protein
MNTELENAVFEQSGAGDRTEFLQILRDVAQHGADQGVSGFIYYTETRAFYLENRALILEQLREDADSMGADSVIGLVASFRCAADFSEDEIGRALYTGADITDRLANCLAWYALEACAYALEDEIEEVAA